MKEKIFGSITEEEIGKIIIGAFDGAWLAMRDLNVSTKSASCFGIYDRIEKAIYDSFKDALDCTQKQV